MLYHYGSNTCIRNDVNMFTNFQILIHSWVADEMQTNEKTLTHPIKFVLNRLRNFKTINASLLVNKTFSTEVGRHILFEIRHFIYCIKFNIFIFQQNAYVFDAYWDFTFIQTKLQLLKLAVWFRKLRIHFE